MPSSRLQPVTHKRSHQAARADLGPCGGVGVSPDAKRHGALMVAVEHRFYGESVPFGDMSTAVRAASGAAKRHSRFPMVIHFVWGFCMRAQGA